MATKTKNYSFTKPDDDDFYDIQLENANWDKADEKMKQMENGLNSIEEITIEDLEALDDSGGEQVEPEGVITDAEIDIMLQA